MGVFSYNPDAQILSGQRNKQKQEHNHVCMTAFQMVTVLLPHM